MSNSFLTGIAQLVCPGVRARLDFPVVRLRNDHRCIAVQKRVGQGLLRRKFRDIRNGRNNHGILCSWPCNGIAHNGHLQLGAGVGS